MEMNIKKLNENAKIPTYGSMGAAGFDLYACNDENIVIKPHETVLIKTGISLEIKEGYVGLIYARSGLATKRSLAPANKVGVIDSDYRGEIMVALHNHCDETQSIEPYERIAQMVITPFVRVEFNEVSELSSTERDNNGFGSTGTK